MTPFRPHHRIVRTEAGAQAWRTETLLPEWRWLLGAVRSEKGWGDLMREASDLSWDRERLERAGKEALARGWIRRSDDDSPLPEVLEGGVRSLQPATALAALLDRRAPTSPVSGSPAPGSSNPPVAKPSSPHRQGSDSMDPVVAVDLEAAVGPEVASPVFEDQISADRISTEQVSTVSESDALPGPVVSEPARTFDESPIAVPEGGSAELLDAMGLGRNGRAGVSAPPPPPPPVWSGTGGLEALLAALEAPSPVGAAPVPEYGYGGQNPSGPVSSGDASFPRLKDTPGASDPDLDSLLPDPSSNSAMDRSSERHQGPNSTLSRELARLRHEEADRMAARARLQKFRQNQARAEAEHRKKEATQKNIDAKQQDGSIRGLSSLVQRRREQQEKSRSGQT